MKLVQSAKKSEYLESKLNQILGINSNGSSDTENNIESIPEIDDMTGENAAQISPENCQLELLSNENIEELETPENRLSDVVDGVPAASSSAVEIQRQSSPLDDVSGDCYTFSKYVKDLEGCSDDESVKNEGEDYVTATSNLAPVDEESLNTPSADDEKSHERDSTWDESWYVYDIP